MKRLTPFALALVALGAAFGAAAQVKTFDRPPTVEELRASLAKSAAAPAAPGVAEAPPAAQPGEDRVRSRAIVWNQPAAAAAARPAAAAVAGAAALPAAATTQPSAQVATAAAAPAAGAGAGQSVALPINFEPGSSRLAVQAGAYIEPIAALLRADPSLRMVIEGHTDASGVPARNLMLSWDRAMTVFKVLVERYGIDPARLQPLGRGSMDPIDPANPEGAVNRRVQFRTMG